MSKEILISIIIAENSKNPDCEKFLFRCITSIKKSTTIPYEILIEDGAKVGPAIARNKAVKNARGKYILFLDYDTEVEKGWLESVVTYLEEFPKIGGGQLKLLRADRKKVFDSAGEKLTPWGFLAERAQEAQDRGQFNKAEPIFSGKGAAMIVRRVVFEQIGGFDEDIFMYWEEPDLSWRIWKAGYEFLFLPMGEVYHKYGSSRKQVERDWDIRITFLGCRNQIMTIIKNAAGWRGVQMFTGAVFGWLVLFGMFGVKRDLRKMGAIFRASAWLLLRPRFLWKKRKKVEHKLGGRFYADNRWLKEVTDFRERGWYIGKAVSYLRGEPF